MATSNPCSMKSRRCASTQRFPTHSRNRVRGTAFLICVFPECFRLNVHWEIAFDPQLLCRYVERSAKRSKGHEISEVGSPPSEMDGERDLVAGTTIYRIARRATQDLHFFHKIPQTRINIRFR